MPRTTQAIPSINLLHAQGGRWHIQILNTIVHIRHGVDTTEKQNHGFITSSLTCYFYLILLFTNQYFLILKIAQLII